MRMSTPRVSVIVPLYNKARYLRRCLDAIAAQTVGDFESIVVDDGSTDDGAAIVESYADPRVRLVRQANAGPGAARNRGAAEASAPVIAMLDADDSWQPDYLERSLRALETAPEVACITWGMMEFPAGRSTESRWARVGIPQGCYRVAPSTPVGVLVGIVSHMLPSSVVIRKRVFDEQAGFYSKMRCLFAEDAYLWLKVLLHYDVLFDRMPLVNRYCDASELSMNLRGVRPIEPFLLDPGDLWDTCPADLAPLLRRFLAARACRTAGVYGYFGRHREARRLMRGFVSLRDWRVPFFPLGILGCTPAAQWAGQVARFARINLRASHAN
jgi:glycosyltransferase involved in cell wall biosynthesis